MDRHSRTQHLLLCVALLTAIVDAQQYTILDVQRVPLTGDPNQALVNIDVPQQPREVACDVLIAGGGMGGIGAALSVTAHNLSVCLTEETDWVGGQATAGGVPALDENRFIEFAGGTRTYMEFRQRVRNWYRERRKLTPQAASWENLNPGSCYVSPLCFEPSAGVDVLTKMLVRPGLQLFLRTQVFAIERQGSTIRSALAWQFDARQVIRFRPRFVLDATEMGDLLPLAKIPYVSGAEAKSQTGEPDAPAAPNPACAQSFTYPFILERDAQATPISKPQDYDRIVARQNFSLQANYPVEFGWRGAFQYRMFGDDPPIPNNMSPGPFFSWRRILAAKNFADAVPHDVALMNWPHQDYAAESPLDQTPEALAGILQRARQTSEAFLYWLQHDLPRDDGKGRGYPELKLRADLMDTADGMSKYPYIRESRRIVARGTVAEQDIVEDMQPGPRARLFDDSVGIGFYMVDIHPCGANERGRMRMPRPFQIPMSALLPREPVNFLPAGKNLGVTHLTNGAFRLHPVEWNIGESAGVIASLWLERGAMPSAAEVQAALAHSGVPLFWFDDLSSDTPAFAAIQLAAIRGIYPLDPTGLHASPSAPVTRAEAAVALAAFFGKRLDQKAAIALAIHEGWMATDHRNWFHPDLPFYWTDWREDKLPSPLPPLATHRTGPVRRSELAERLSH
jgi:hypothetical protein